MRRLHLIFLLLAFTLCVASSAAPQTNEAAPVVNECSPTSASINSVIALRGLRLGLGEPEWAKVVFVQNGIEIPARTRGGSSTTNDHLNGPQTLDVIVPEQLALGPAQVVAERNGFRSAPVSITITEWTVPIIREITPASGPPGTLVHIDCENLHVDDDIELTDLAGRGVKSREGAGSSQGTAFVVPGDFPEGVLRIRLGNPKRGKNQFTPFVDFVVTNDALPLELVTEWIKSVAPGQWIDLQASSLAPLKHAERTEVSFKQTGREIIMNAPRPVRPHVEVPAVLSPGEVQVQVRTWRSGSPSNWSTPVSLQLAEKPLPPYVAALRLDNGHWVQLQPGPDRPKRFTAAPGDLIVMNGIYPVADADKLKVLLVSLGKVVELDVTELNENADWFCDVSVKLPTDIGSGNWQMIVRAIDGTEHVVPIPIRISRR